MSVPKGKPRARAWAFGLPPARRPIANPAMKHVLTAAALCAAASAGAVDLAGTLAGHGQFGQLLGAIEAAGLAPLLRQSGPYTIFAPNDAAVAALPPERVARLMKPENRNELKKLLSYHIVVGRVGAGDWRERRISVRSASGMPLTHRGRARARDGQRSACLADRDRRRQRRDPRHRPCDDAARSRRAEDVKPAEGIAAWPLPARFAPATTASAAVSASAAARKPRGRSAAKNRCRAAARFARAHLRMDRRAEIHELRSAGHLRLRAERPALELVVRLARRTGHEHRVRLGRDGDRLVDPRALLVVGTVGHRRRDGAVLIVLITLSFMFTTPGVAAAEAGGFPALSAEIGQFLLKDLVLLAASVYVMGDSLLARRRR